VKYLAAFLALAAALALGALFLLQDNSADTLPSGASASAGVDKLGWRKPELVSPDKVRPPAAPAIIDDMPPAAAPADSADGSSQAAQSALPQGELPVPVSLPEKLTAESVSSALCAVTNSVSGKPPAFASRAARCRGARRLDADRQGLRRIPLCGLRRPVQCEESRRSRRGPEGQGL
jgi:hypothetical protein